MTIPKCWRVWKLSTHSLWVGNGKWCSTLKTICIFKNLNLQLTLHSQLPSRQWFQRNENLHFYKKPICGCWWQLYFTSSKLETARCFSMGWVVKWQCIHTMEMKQQLKQMAYWDTNNPGWISRELCSAEKLIPNGYMVVQFYLHIMLEMTKL